MRALITGGYGFAGRHLAHYLVSCGDDVAVSYHPKDKTDGRPAAELEVRGVALPNSVQSLALDVTNRKSVSDLLALLKPDTVYHLAGVTFVPEAERDYQKVFEVNFQGTLNLLDAVREHSKDTRVLFVSSSEVYGEPRPGSLPLTELSVLRPISSYGLSKAAADLAVFKYAFHDSLNAVRVRPFTHIGPGQASNFALSSFAKQVAEIKLGRAKPVVKVGVLDVKRDFSDVSDIVRGYREIALNGKRGEVYNLCSGTSVGVGELLQKLLKIAEVDAEIEVDPERVRPVVVPEMVGSFQKAQKELGWKPRIVLEGTLSSLLAYWLEVLG